MSAGHVHAARLFDAFNPTAAATSPRFGQVLPPPLGLYGQGSVRSICRLGEAVTVGDGVLVGALAPSRTSATSRRYTGLPANTRHNQLGYLFGVGKSCPPVLLIGFALGAEPHSAR